MRQTRWIAVSEYASARVPLAGEEVGQGVGEQSDVGEGEVQALGAGGRHDVRRVAGEEQVAVAHRRGDEAAHRRDALVADRTFGQ